MYNSNTKVVVCNSVKQSPQATAAFCCKQLTFGSDVTENGGYAQSALLQSFWESAEFNGLRKRLINYL